jgi:hypothetical protein
VFSIVAVMAGIKCFEHGKPTAWAWLFVVFSSAALLTLIGLASYLVNNAVNDPSTSSLSIQSSSTSARSSGASSSVSAAGLTSGNPGECASFAVIAINEVGSTKDAFPYINKLRTFYPLNKYATSVINQISDIPSDPTLIPAWITSALAPKMNEMETLAQGFVKKNIRVIHMPTRSLMVAPWLNGQFQYYDANNVLQTVKFFGGKTVTQRYPAHVQFTFSNAGTGAIDNYPSCVRFDDVDTAGDSSLITGNLASFGLVPGDTRTKILFVNEPGDGFSLENWQSYSQLAAGIGYLWPSTETTGDGQIYSYNMTWTGSAYASTDNANLATRIAQVFALSPTNVLVIATNPAGVQDHANAFTTQFAQANQALANAVASYPPPTTNVVIYGLNWSPSPITGSAGVDVQVGYNVGIPIPTLEMTALGLPLDPNAFANAVVFDNYVLDAAKWASLCLTKNTLPATGIYSLQGSEYKFAPGTNTLVSKWLFKSIIYAGQTGVTNNFAPYRINGIWSGNVAIPPGS